MATMSPYPFVDIILWLDIVNEWKNYRKESPILQYCMVKSTAAIILKNKAIKVGDVVMGGKKQLK